MFSSVFCLLGFGAEEAGVAASRSSALIAARRSLMSLLFTTLLSFKDGWLQAYRGGARYAGVPQYDHEKKSLAVKGLGYFFYFFFSSSSYYVLVLAYCLSWPLILLSYLTLSKQMLCCSTSPPAETWLTVYRRLDLTHSSNSWALPPRRSVMLDVNISIWKILCIWVTSSVLFKVFKSYRSLIFHEYQLWCSSKPKFWTGVTLFENVVILRTK